MGRTGSHRITYGSHRLPRINENKRLFPDTTYCTWGFVKKIHTSILQLALLKYTSNLQKMSNWNCSICKQKDARPVGMLTNAFLGFKENQSRNVCLECRTEFNAVDFSRKPIIQQLDRVYQAIFLNRQKVLDGTAKYRERMVEGMMQVIILILSKGVLGKYTSASAENIVNQLLDKTVVIKSEGCVRALILNSATSIPNSSDECDSICETASVDEFEYSVSEKPEPKTTDSVCNSLISIDKLESLPHGKTDIVNALSNGEVTTIGGTNGFTLCEGKNGQGFVASVDCWGQPVAHLFIGDKAGEALSKLMEDRARYQMLQQQEETKRQIQIRQIEENTKLQQQQLEEETKRQTLLRQHEATHCPNQARAAAECQIIAAETAHRIAALAAAHPRSAKPAPAAKRPRQTPAAPTVVDMLSEWLVANPCSSDITEKIFLTKFAKGDSVAHLVAENISVPLFTLVLMQYMRLKHDNSPVIPQALENINHPDHKMAIESASHVAKHIAYVLVHNILPELRNKCKSVVTHATLAVAAPLAAALDVNRGGLARKLVLYDEGATRSALRCLTAALVKATGYVAPLTSKSSIFVIPATPATGATNIISLRRSGNPDVVCMKDPSLLQCRPSPDLCCKMIRQEADHLDHHELLDTSRSTRGKQYIQVSGFLRKYMKFTRGEARDLRKHEDPDDWLVPDATQLLRRWKVIVGDEAHLDVSQHKLVAAASILLILRTTNHDKCEQPSV